MYTLHKQMQNCSPRCSNTTPWRSRISRLPHKLKGHWSRCSQRRFLIFQARSRYSWQNSPQCRPITRGLRKQNTNQPQLGRDIGRPATRPRRRRNHLKIATYIVEEDRGSTLIGTAPPMYSRWRSTTLKLHAGFQTIIITSQLRD